jgi:hypothetical protein
MRGELKTYSWAEPTRIPTFFPPGDSDPYQEYGYHIGVAIVSMLFGLIHCLGWSLVFLSGTERLIWRLSAVQGGGGTWKRDQHSLFFFRSPA